LPSSKTEREQYANQVGADGWQLLDAVDEASTPSWLRELPAVQTLRRMWVQQYHPRKLRAPWTARRSSSKPDDAPEAPDEEPDGHWRAKAELAPSNQAQNSPYDPDARDGKKRETSRVGYKLDMTETC
jgi:transposase